VEGGEALAGRGQNGRRNSTDGAANASRQHNDSVGRFSCSDAASLRVDPWAREIHDLEGAVTPMVAEHLANGMYGLILVEPEGRLGLCTASSMSCR